MSFDLDLGVKLKQDIAQYPLHHVTYAPAKFEAAMSKGGGVDAFRRKYSICPVTLTLGSRSHKRLPSTLYIMLPMHLQSLKLLHPKVEEMHLKENTVFDLGVKVTQNIAQYPLHHVTYAAPKFEVATSNSLGGDAFTRKYSP